MTGTGWTVQELGTTSGKTACGSGTIGGPWLHFYLRSTSQFFWTTKNTRYFQSTRKYGLVSGKMIGLARSVLYIIYQINVR